MGNGSGVSCLCLIDFKCAPLVKRSPSSFLSAPPPLPPSSFSSSFNFSLLFAAAAITASYTFTRALLTATPTAARLANVIRSSSSGALLYQIIYILGRPSGNSIEPNLKLAVCFHSRRSGLLSDARSVSAHLFLCISHPVRHCLTNFLTSNVLSPPPSRPLFRHNSSEG